MIFFVFILMIAAVVAIARRRRRTAIAALVLQVIIFLGLASGLVPALLLKPLQQDYTLQPEILPRNISLILVLGVGVESLPNGNSMPGIFSFARLAGALEVYHHCAPDCKILLSGGDAQQIGTSEARVYAEYLNKIGVPAENVLIEDRSRNTWENMKNSAVMIRNLPASDGVVVVTSAVHLKRSLLYLRHFGIEAHPYVADYLSPTHSIVPNAYNFVLADIALHEYIGIARYDVYNAAGLNEPAVPVAR